MGRDPLEALAEAMEGDIDPPSPETQRLLLDLARHVAHSTERKNAPLATYLAGFYAARSEASPEAAVAEVVEAARRSIEEPDDSVT